MSLHISRRKIMTALGLATVLAAGVLLIARGDLTPSLRPGQGGAPGPTASGAFAGTDRALPEWPVDQLPPPGSDSRRAPSARSRAPEAAGPPAQRGASGISSAFSGLAAGPASLPSTGPGLDGSAPTGLPTAMSAEERERLMSDRNATERGTAPGPRRDRGGIRIRVADDDQCVPRPPRPQF